MKFFLMISRDKYMTLKWISVHLENLEDLGHKDIHIDKVIMRISELSLDQDILQQEYIMKISGVILMQKQPMRKRCLMNLTVFLALTRRLVKNKEKMRHEEQM